MLLFDRVHPRFLVPNALTAASLLLGVSAIVQATHQNYSLSAWLIVWCALLDIADGKVAKLIGATSEFGMQFDSLADVVAFCVAPAVLVYLLLTTHPAFADQYATPLAQIVVIACMGFYVLTGALRLARYNLKTHDVGDERFAGLPTTIAGALVATCLLAAWELKLPDGLIAAVPAFVLLLGALMISTSALPRNLFGTSPRARVVTIAFAVVACALGFSRSLPTVLFILALGYPLFGFPLGTIQRKRRRAIRKLALDE